MNPFTRFLLGKHQPQDVPLVEFIEHWDALERLVIRVYRRRQATADDEAEYQKLHHWLAGHFPQWQSDLEPYWQEPIVGGEIAHEDPFSALLAAGKAADFANNWAAMQTLPAAREALNRFLSNS